MRTGFGAFSGWAGAVRPVLSGLMRNEFTAIIERDADWYVAYCPDVPGANGQGRTKEEARKNLADSISLILEDRCEDALRGLPPDAERETVRLDEARRPAPAPPPARVLPETRRPVPFALARIIHERPTANAASDGSS
jgi:predicted RNase H-like HicB family nuclease